MKPSVLFNRGDLDGFFGLFVDNLLQIMLIVLLGPVICGFSSQQVAEQIRTASGPGGGGSTGPMKARSIPHRRGP